MLVTVTTKSNGVSKVSSMRNSQAQLDPMLEPLENPLLPLPDKNDDDPLDDALLLP